MFYFDAVTEVNVKSPSSQTFKNTRVAESTRLDMGQRMNSRVILSGLVIGIATFATAGAPASPVAPAAPELRPFQADRPDQTEGPFTVVPGHLQVELDLINLSVNRSAGQRSTTWNTAPVLFRCSSNTACSTTWILKPDSAAGPGIGLKTERPATRSIRTAVAIPCCA